jgi:hypothetical protein
MLYEYHHGKKSKQRISVSDQDPHGSDSFLVSRNRIHIRMKTQIKVEIQVLWIIKIQHWKAVTLTM